MSASLPGERSERRAEVLFQEHLSAIYRRTDHLFAWLMVFQWIAAVAAAFWISPRTWLGQYSQTHVHVWAAIFLGGTITALPVYLALKHAGRVYTRHIIAIGQMMMSALLIHLTGGRIETHFHVFGSLAILAFYRDWRVVISASAIVYVDHLLRGIYWPQSVYGVMSAPLWRAFEHAGWVLFEDAFLLIASRQSLKEMFAIAERQAKMEVINESVECKVSERTEDLANANTELQAEISERKRAEWQLNIQYAISRILAESSTLKQASSGILQTVCESLNWDVGEFWNVNRRNGVMQFDDMWTAPNTDADEFMILSRQMTFARGVGLPGRVWETGRPVWIPDVAVDADFPRGAAAKMVGLHGAFSFPILAGNEVVGAIEFLSREVRQPDEELLRVFAVLGSQLGQFIERKRLEEHLIQSQKMETVGRLSGGIAHEFNSILTAIIGESELLVCDLPSGNPLSKNATEIRKAAERAAVLTRQLLAYGRKQTLQPEILDLNSVLARMETTLRHLMGRGADVHIALATGLKPVKADAGQIEQVIMNMAMNAADAMPNGGTLTLESANITVDQEHPSRFPELKAGEYVMLAITDTGTGMSEEVKARVFEPFFSTKDVGQGTGLGLATCYGIIKQSGGHISVHSELPRGTTFKIYLPQVEQETKIPIRRLDSPDLPRGRETILLVEGDPAMGRLAATLLRRLGYTVLTAANGIEALSLQQRGSIRDIDLLFTDVVMPDMSGRELSERVRVLYPQTRILFTSVYADNAIGHEGVLSKGVALLQKPFTPSALAHKLREVLDQPSVRNPDTAHRTFGFTKICDEVTVPQT